MKSRAMLAVLGAIGVLLCCGPPKAPPGKSVTVKDSMGSQVSNGNYEVQLGLGFISLADDGGFQSVSLSSALKPGPDKVSHGLQINLSDVTIGKVQSLTPGAVGWAIDPTNPASRTVWGALDGKLTVTAYDKSDISLTLTDAKMTPVPLPDGGARGTFTVDADLKTTGLLEL